MKMPSYLLTRQFKITVFLIFLDVSLMIERFKVAV
uniref:Putative spore germination integral inner membrane protein n=1 Tax=mine drainage metagenome TaxID=410659 RepID=E6QTQ1_9ZZZZ